MFLQYLPYRPELDRPGKDLFTYEMTSLLHQAIRSTNAQYDDPEILSQLEVKLLDSFDGMKNFFSFPFSI